MGTWTVTPDDGNFVLGLSLNLTGATDEIHSQRVSFSANTELQNLLDPNENARTYTITYTDGNCSASTTYTIPAGCIDSDRPVKPTGGTDTRPAVNISLGIKQEASGECYMQGTLTPTESALELYNNGINIFLFGNICYWTNNSGGTSAYSQITLDNITRNGDKFTSGNDLSGIQPYEKVTKTAWQSALCNSGTETATLSDGTTIRYVLTQYSSGSGSSGGTGPFVPVN